MRETYLNQLEKGNQVTPTATLVLSLTEHPKTIDVNRRYKGILRDFFKIIKNTKFLNMLQFRIFDQCLKKY